MCTRLTRSSIVVFHFICRTKVGLGQNLTEAGVLGRIYTAREALDAGIVQGVAKGADVLPDAVKMARQVIPQGGHNRKSLQNMKKVLYQPLYDAAAQQNRSEFLKSSL